MPAEPHSRTKKTGIGRGNKARESIFTMITGMTVTRQHRCNHNQSKEVPPGFLGLCVIVTNKLTVLTEKSSTQW